MDWPPDNWGGEDNNQERELRKKKEGNLRETPKTSPKVKRGKKNIGNEAPLGWKIRDGQKLELRRRPQ